jgi:hypothetical protein
MSNKKMKVEFTDEEGGKFTLSLEGILSKEKMTKIIEVFEYLGGDKTKNENDNDNNTNTCFAKVINLIEEKYSTTYFTSSQLLELYEDTYQTPIKKSTISTYLNRLTDQRLVKRNRNSHGFIYCKVNLILNKS